MFNMQKEAAMDRPFYPAKIIEFIPTLLPYLFVTLELLFGTMIVGRVLGCFLAKARLSKRAWKRRTAFVMLLP